MLEGRPLQELFDPRLGGPVGGGPHQHEDRSVGEVGQQPFQNGGAQEPGHPGDQDALAFEVSADVRAAEPFPGLYHAVDYGQGVPGGQIDWFGATPGDSGRMAGPI